MEEASKRRWEMGIRAGGPLLIAAAFVLGAWQIHAANERALRNQYDFALWSKRLETYSSVAKLVGLIAEPPDDTAFQSAVAGFLAAYWSEMILVEDQAVEAAMKSFRTEIEDYRKGRSSADRIKLRARELMTAFKTSLGSERQR